MKAQKQNQPTEREKRLEDIDLTMAYLKNCIWWLGQEGRVEETKKQAIAHLIALKNKIENL